MGTIADLHIIGTCNPTCTQSLRTAQLKRSLHLAFNALAVSPFSDIVSEKIANRPTRLSASLHVPYWPSLAPRRLSPIDYVHDGDCGVLQLSNRSLAQKIARSRQLDERYSRVS